MMCAHARLAVAEGRHAAVLHRLRAASLLWAHFPINPQGPTAFTTKKKKKARHSPSLSCLPLGYRWDANERVSHESEGLKAQKGSDTPTPLSAHPAREGTSNPGRVFFFFFFRVRLSEHASPMLHMLRWIAAAHEERSFEQWSPLGDEGERQKLADPLNWAKTSVQIRFLGC